MSSLIKIGTISPVALRSGAFATVLLEIEVLRGTVECNAWHRNQTVFDHTAGVFEGIIRVARMISNSKNRELQYRLASHSPDELCRCELLLLGALLHDTAKPETLIISADGTTACLDHERVGSLKVAGFRKRFGLSLKETRVIAKLVEFHGMAYTMLTLAGHHGEVERYLKYLRLSAPDIYPELLMLHYADMLGGDTPPEEFVRRRKIIETELSLNGP